MGRRDKALLFVDFEGIDTETYGIDPTDAGWGDAVEFKKELLAVAAAATTKLCKNCGKPIVMTPSGWVHEGGRLNCFGSTIAITFAEPTQWTDAEDD